MVMDKVVFVVGVKKNHQFVVTDKYSLLYGN